MRALGAGVLGGLLAELATGAAARHFEGGNAMECFAPGGQPVRVEDPGFEQTNLAQRDSMAPFAAALIRRAALGERREQPRRTRSMEAFRLEGSQPSRKPRHHCALRR